MEGVDPVTACGRALDACRTRAGRALLREWVRGATTPLERRRAVHATLFATTTTYDHDTMTRLVATLVDLHVPEYDAEAVRTSATAAQRFCEQVTISARTAMSQATRLAPFGEPWTRWNRKATFARSATLTTLTPLRVPREALHEADRLGGDLVVRWNHMYVAVPADVCDASNSTMVVIEKTPRRTVVTSEVLEALSSRARREARRGVEIETDAERAYWCPLAASIVDGNGNGNDGGLATLRAFERACAEIDAVVAWRTHGEHVLASCDGVVRLALEQALLLSPRENDEKDLGRFIRVTSPRELVAVLDNTNTNTTREAWAVELAFRVSSGVAKEELERAGRNAGFGYFHSALHV